MIIGSLSETLANILKIKKYQYINSNNSVEEISEVDVSFSPLSLMGDINRTTINLFLFNIRENEKSKTGDANLIKRIKKPESDEIINIPPYIRIACSYIVTVWPKVSGDIVLNEHRLISQVIQNFMSFPVIKGDLLKGNLRSEIQGYLPEVRLYLTRDIIAKETFDLWELLKVDLRASFMISAEVSMPTEFYYNTLEEYYVKEDGINYNIEIKRED